MPPGEFARWWHRGSPNAELCSCFLYLATLENHLPLQPTFSPGKSKYKVHSLYSPVSITGYLALDLQAVPSLHIQVEDFNSFLRQREK